ncbi:hypothetical protein VPH35_061782 [Triticum aestivum]|uniref:Uncharacterized protein n=1 Tax=Aegilops tauschii TaxID=37682 RepID=N1QVR9_AEGTA
MATATVPEGRPGSDCYSPSWRVEYSTIPSLMRPGGEVDSAKIGREVAATTAFSLRPSPPQSVFLPERGKGRGRRRRKDPGLPNKPLPGLPLANEETVDGKGGAPR